MFFSISILFLFLFSNVESNYNVFTYDDGLTNDEHCCFVRLDEQFCLAKPLTRSLIQVNKQCQQLKFKEKSKNSLNQIVRRLNVETSNKIGNNILIQLKKPLDNNVLKQDLVCLTQTNNNINLEKCYVELKIKKEKKSKNETIDEVVVEQPKIERIDLTKPVEIQQNQGVYIRQIYELNLTDFQPITKEQQQCFIWFRTNTKKFCTHPMKYKQMCTTLNTDGRTCVEQIFNKTLLKSFGTKLFCENFNKQNRFIGYFYRSEICFISHNQITIQHKFTDFVNLSDGNHNKDLLEFISNSTKFTNEYENDCHDKTTLAEIKKSMEQQN